MFCLHIFSQFFLLLLLPGHLLLWFQFFSHFFLILVSSILWNLYCIVKRTFCYSNQVSFLREGVKRLLYYMKSLSCINMMKKIQIQEDEENYAKMLILGNRTTIIIFITYLLLIYQPYYHCHDYYYNLTWLLLPLVMPLLPFLPVFVL